MFQILHQIPYYGGPAFPYTGDENLYTLSRHCYGMCSAGGVIRLAFRCARIRVRQTNPYELSQAFGLEDLLAIHVKFNSSVYAD